MCDKTAFVSWRSGRSVGDPCGGIRLERIRAGIASLRRPGLRNPWRHFCWRVPSGRRDFPGGKKENGFWRRSFFADVCSWKRKIFGSLEDITNGELRQLIDRITVSEKGDVSIYPARPAEEPPAAPGAFVGNG